MNQFEDRDILTKTAQLLDLPMDVVAGLPNYSDTAIDVNCGTLLVRVRGQGLQLLSMTADEMRIGGIIESIELAR